MWIFNNFFLPNFFLHPFRIAKLFGKNIFIHLILTPFFVLSLGVVCVEIEMYLELRTNWRPIDTWTSFRYLPNVGFCLRGKLTRSLRMGIDWWSPNGGYKVVGWTLCPWKKGQIDGEWNFMSKKILMKLKLVGLVVGDDNVVGYGMIVLQ
jgi:hypothetical protein